MTHNPDGGVGQGALQVFAAALLASVIAGAIGLIVVFGQGLLEPPANTFIVAGLVYAVIPGVPALLAIRRLLRNSRAGTARDLANTILFSAMAAVLWFLPFMGVFVPYDQTNAVAAVGGMAGTHALSGAISGLAFWLLTRRGRNS
jgi:uncharacterized membrane protein